MFFYEKIKIRRFFLVFILAAFALTIGRMIIEGTANISFNDNLFDMLLDLVLLAWLLWKLKKDENNLSDFTENLRKQVKWRENILLVFFHILITFGFIFLLVLIMSFVNPGAVSSVLNDDAGVIPFTTSSKVFYIVTAVFLAPVVEELVFRGIILNRLRVKWGMNKAIIISSILFGILHYKLAIVGAFTFGICLSLLYIKTKNIIVPMTAHFLNNLLVGIVMLVSGNASGVEAGLTLSEMRLSGLLIGVLFTTVAVIFFIYYFKRNWPKAEQCKAMGVSIREKGTALLIVDMQQGLFTLPGRTLLNAEGLTNNVIDLINMSHAKKIPVVYVLQGSPRSGFLQRGTEGWMLHYKLAPINGDIIVHKTTPDSFYETTLQKELSSRNIGNLIIAGLQTDYCIDATCKRAFSLGYKVTLVSDAHSTYDTEEMEASQIVKHHNRILKGWFVELKSTKEMLGQDENLSLEASVPSSEV